MVKHNNSVNRYSISIHNDQAKIEVLKKLFALYYLLDTFEKLRDIRIW